MITTAGQIVWLYAAWVGLSGVALWVLAGRSLQWRQHRGLLWAAAIVTIICVVSLVYALTASAGPPRTAFRVFLNDRGSLPLLASFAVWPFLGCAAVAQIANRLRVAPLRARWVSFGLAFVLTLATPLAALMAGCAMAGACF